MRGYLKYLFGYLLLSFSLAPGLQASHGAGVGITYECLNTCTTRIHLRLYRDCSGATGIGPSSVTLGSPTSCTLPTLVSGPSTVIRTEVTPLHSSFTTRCTSPSAPINGIEELYSYSDYNFCNSNCTEVTASWTTCCRQPNITSSPTGNSSNLNISVTIRRPSNSCNNSPVFHQNPIFYTCLGSTTHFDQGATDPDGDSLVYALVPCLNGNMLFNYGTGYSATNPLGPSFNVSINRSTGLITIAPNPGSVQVGPICLEVEEYRNGTLVGRVVRDMLVTTMNCPCPTVDPDFTSVSNLSSGLQSGDTIFAASGDSLCFQLNSFDPDTFYTQHIYLPAPFAGGTLMDTTGTPDDTVSAQSPSAIWCWSNPTAGSHQVTFYIEETGCITNALHRDTLTLTLVISDPDTVWPGDANDDLIANNLDILAVGLGFGSTGPVRSNASNNWVAQPGLAWNDTIPGGIDKQHGDCNGDGTIDFADTVAIAQNYGLTHPKNGLGFSPITTGAGIPVFIEFRQDSALVGDTVTADIYLGDSTTSAANVYGLAMNVNYDAQLVDSGTVRVQFDSSWFATPASSVQLSRDFFSSQRVECGYSRIDQVSQTGRGRIGGITLVLTDNIDGKTFSIVADTLLLSLSNISLIGSDGKALSVDPRFGSLIVYEVITDQPAAPEPALDQLEVFPVPATHSLWVRHNSGEAFSAEIIDLSGQVQRRYELRSGLERLSVDGMATGLYFIRLSNQNRTLVQKIILQ